MKILNPCFVFSLMLFSSCSKEFHILSTDVPATVTSAFQIKYPDANNVEWEVEKEEGHLVFEAEFDAGGKKKEASFKTDGTFINEE